MTGIETAFLPLVRHCRRAALLFGLLVAFSDSVSANAGGQPAWLGGERVVQTEDFVAAFASAAIVGPDVEPAAKSAEAAARQALASIVSVTIRARDRSQSSQIIRDRDVDVHKRIDSNVEQRVEVDLLATTCPDRWHDESRREIHVRCVLDKRALLAVLQQRFGGVREARRQAQQSLTAYDLPTAIDAFGRAEAMLAAAAPERRLAAAFLPDHATSIFGGSPEPSALSQERAEVVARLRREIRVEVDPPGPLHAGKDGKLPPQRLRFYLGNRVLESLTPVVDGDEGTDLRVSREGDRWRIDVIRLARPSDGNRGLLRVSLPRHLDPARSVLIEIPYTAEIPVRSVAVMIDASVPPELRAGLAQSLSALLVRGGGIEVVSPATADYRLEVALDTGLEMDQHPQVLYTSKLHLRLLRPDGSVLRMQSTPVAATGPSGEYARSSAVAQSSAALRKVLPKLLAGLD